MYHSGYILGILACMEDSGCATPCKPELQDDNYFLCSEGEGINLWLILDGILCIILLWSLSSFLLNLTELGNQITSQ